MIFQCLFTVEFQVLFAWESTLAGSTGDVGPQQDWGFVLLASFLKLGKLLNKDD